MKKVVVSTLLITFLLLNGMAQKKTIKFKTNSDSLSYGLGVSIAQNLNVQGVTDINIDILIKGVKDIIEEKELALSQEEIGKIVVAYMKEKTEKKNQAIKEMGKKFLEKNSKREGVVTLKSGLQYEIIEAGKGEIPKASDKVTTHYQGTLLDGTIFDSSIKRGEPATFPVSGVIKGWVEALQLMPVGSKWRLYVPYDLAYGERGAGSQIGPYSTLVFDIELIEIVK